MLGRIYRLSIRVIRLFKTLGMKSYYKWLIVELQCPIQQDYLTLVDQQLL